MRQRRRPVRFSRFWFVAFWALLWIVPANSAFGRSLAGETLRMVVGYSPGGGFDLVARLMVKHLGDHVSGKPRTIVQNMPGAGGVVAANWVYRQPGTKPIMVTFHYALVTQALMQDPAVKFDPLKYRWLGDPTVGGVPQVLWVRNDLPIRSMEDLRNRTEPIAIGATGVGTAGAVGGEYLKSLGFPIKMVYGYKGNAGVMAAIERKELDARVLSQGAMQTTWRRFVNEGVIRPVLAMGNEPKLKPLAGVQTLNDLQLTPEQRQLGDFLIRSWSLLRVYAAPPGTPDDLLMTLREGVTKTMQSSAFLKDAGKQKQIIVPVSGEEVEKLIQGLTGDFKKMSAAYKQLIGIK